jgi:hypothetical protein
MNFRFTASVCGMALAIAAGAAAQAGPAPAAADRIQPYFAVRTVETFDSNGKSLSTSYALEERDSHGRRLSAPISSPDQRGQLTRATVWDPVKVRMIEINYTAHVATVTQFPPGAVTHLLPPTQPFMTDDPNRSDLPEKSLNDFKVKGYTWKTEDPSAAADATAATPPPRQQAIGFSMTVYPLTHEFWWSPALRVFLLSTVRDGNGNKQVVRYDQIQLKEPTAEDFAIPAGFQVRTIQAQSGMH